MGPGKRPPWSHAPPKGRRRRRRRRRISLESPRRRIQGGLASLLSPRSLEGSRHRIPETRRVFPTPRQKEDFPPGGSRFSGWRGIGAGSAASPQDPFPPDFPASPAFACAAPARAIPWPLLPFCAARPCPPRRAAPCASLRGTYARLGQPGNVERRRSSRGPETDFRLYVLPATATGHHPGHPRRAGLAVAHAHGRGRSSSSTASCPGRTASASCPRAAAKASASSFPPPSGTASAW